MYIVKGLRIFNGKKERIMISIVCYNKAINVRKYSCDPKAPHIEKQSMSEIWG